MTTLTTPDNLVIWTVSDPDALSTASAAMQNSVQTALGTRQIKSYKWTNASGRTSQTGMGAGDIGYQNDTKVAYQYNGTAWDSGDTGWTSATLGTGWTHEPSNPVQYKRKNGVVYMRGRASTAGTQTGILTFPPGFLPDYPPGTANRGFDLRGTSSGSVSLTPAGALSLATGSASVYYDFLNVSFLVP